jgi:hypothetical protein
LSKDDFQTWMYEHVHSLTWTESFGPMDFDINERLLIFNTAEEYHLGHILHDLIQGGAGDPDYLDPTEVFLPDVLDIMPADDLSKWIDEKLTPEFWAALSSDDRQKLVQAADLYGLKDKLKPAVVGPYGASILTSVVPTTKYDFTGLKSAADIGTPKTGISSFKNLTVATGHELQKDMLAKAGKSGWTPAEKAAVKYYNTKVGYQSMNAVLRNDEDRMKLFTDEQLKKAAKEVVAHQNAMTPLTESVVLHRGTGAQAFGFKTTDIDFDSLKKFEGKDVDELGFLSTSVIPPLGQVGYDYATSKPIKMIIRAPEGTPGVYFPAVGDPTENEFVLAAGSRLHIDVVREADAHDKLNYGDSVKHVVVATVVPGIKHPLVPVTSTLAAPVSPSTAIPAQGLTPTPLATSWTLPGTPLKKLTTTYLQKGVFKPGEVVAWRKMPGSSGLIQQIFWSGGKKKFGVRLSVSGGAGSSAGNGLGWHDAQYYGKKPTYEMFKGEAGWIKPPPGLDITEPPPVLGPPISAVAAPVKTPKLSVHDINNQYGTIPPLTDAAKSSFFKNFKKSPAVDTTKLSDMPATIFKSLAYAVAKHNAEYTGLGNTIVHLNFLQALKLIDEKTAKSVNAPNTNAYQTKVADWLQTADGKNFAPAFIDWADEEVKKQKSISDWADKQKGILPGQVSHLSSIKDMKTPGEIGTPISHANVSTYLNLNDTTATGMQNQMFTNAGLSHWTHAQKSAMGEYTSSSYGINGVLRKKSMNPTYTQQAVDLQTAMLPVTKSIRVWRGTDGLGKEFSYLDEVKNMVGHTFIDDSFFSTSIHKSKAFHKKYLIDLEVPEGTPGAYAEISTSVSGEHEFLVAAGTKYKILSVEPDPSSSSRHIVKMRVVA